MKNKNYTIKKRSEGETSFAMSEAVWENVNNLDLSAFKKVFEEAKKENRRKKK